MAELNDTSLINDANLVAYYRFSAGALTTDTKASYTLTNTGSIAESTSGKFAGCANFPGGTGKSLNWTTDNMGISNGAFSLVCWVKLNAETTSVDYMFASKDSNVVFVTSRIPYEYNGGTIRLGFDRVKQGVEAQGGYYTVSLGTTTWHHLAHTYDGSNIRGYLDGVLRVGPTAASGNGSSGGGNGLWIGADAGNGNVANALIDDFAVFSDALTAAEVTTLYEDAAVAGKAPFSLNSKYW
mgnify:CR=1 FL=1